MLAYVFPGQGSQRRGMGETLFDEVPEYRQVEPEIDGLLGYSMRELCLRDPQNVLGRTEFTQPALYVANALYYYKAMRAGGRPSLLAGHSLGEYNALLAAGAFDLITGLRIVKKRGELMSTARDGGMAAVVGISTRHIADVLRDPVLFSLDVAAFNAPMQTVLSGPRDVLEKAEQPFKEAGAQLYARLEVSAAFHSRYMGNASSAFAEFLEGVRFHPLHTRVFSNVTGAEYPAGDPSAVIRPLLVRQLTQPVRWTQNVKAMLDAGASSFREIGPGNVLARLVQQIERTASL